MQNKKQMKEIVNYKLKDFVNCDEQTIESYVLAFKFLKPIPTLKKIAEMKWKHVEKIRECMTSGDDLGLVDAVCMVQKCTKKEVLEMKIIKFFSLISSIKKQLETISRAEESLQPSYVDMKWEAVDGSKRMSKFGIYNTLELISGGNALDYKKYMNMNYSEIFAILLMRKTANEIQHEMNNIKDVKK